MKLRSVILLLLGLIILLVAASQATQLSEIFPNLGDYSTESHNLDVTIKTNGSDVSVQTSAANIFNYPPEDMVVEMQNKALIDVQSDNSTVDSVKADMKTIASKYNYTAEVEIDSQFGIDQLPMPATVKGTSMVPTLQDGQSITVLKTTNFKVGDIVVAHHPTYGLIVKRLAEINDGQVYLKSDNRQIIVNETGVFKGLDTWLPREDVIGVVKIY